MVSLNTSPSIKCSSVCTTCQASHTNQEDIIIDKPIWYDEEGAIHFELPDELKCLREGEKLLIQKVTAYVPLLHLQNGQIGSRGHACSFVQEILNPRTLQQNLIKNSSGGTA